MDTPKTVPLPVRERMAALEEEIEATKARIAEEESHQQASAEMRAACALLADDPMAVFDDFGQDQQDAICRLLLSDVRVLGTGHGSGRKHHALSLRDNVTGKTVDLLEDQRHAVLLEGGTVVRQEYPHNPTTAEGRATGCCAR